MFSNQIQAICAEMGAQLQHAAFSTNIRDRLDFSCAIFDAQGKLCAQAAHIPVHLGSMAYAMQSIVKNRSFSRHKMIIINDPFSGGTHLPDVTVIAPLFFNHQCLGFVCNRAHHADIGASTPGSMPVSSSIHQEGVIIKATEVIFDDLKKDANYQAILKQLKNSAASHGDFQAQIGANITGIKRLQAWLQKQSAKHYISYIKQLNDYGKRIALQSINTIPNGVYTFTDYMDDDGQEQKNIKILLLLSKSNNHVNLDFTGSFPQVKGNINCPFSVTAAAVYYVFRCLMPSYTPACQGIFDAINIQIPNNCFLNAKYPSATAAGNVETSTRIVDVVLGALAQAIPNKIPAAAYGSMNNLAMGSSKAPFWDYYETIGGGSGAHSKGQGVDAKQAHLTNTLNTPIEVMELNYPVRINKYAIRTNSGGIGKFSGGNGIEKEIEFLQDAHLSLLTERRSYAPWGLNEGKNAKTSINTLNGKTINGKVSLAVVKGDTLSIKTSGGGGWGKETSLPPSTPSYTTS